MSGLIQHFGDKPKFCRATRAKGSSRPERRRFANLVQSKWGGAGRHFAVLKSPKLAVNVDAVPFGALKAGQLKVASVGTQHEPDWRLCVSKSCVVLLSNVRTGWL